MTNKSISKKYIFSYNLNNFELSEDNRTITLNIDNTAITHEYDIIGIMINGILYSGDEIVVNEEKTIITFNNFDLRLTDEIKLLISESFN